MNNLSQFTGYIFFLALTGALVLNNFLSKTRYKYISEYICMDKLYEYDTNEYSYRGISEYPNIRNTLLYSVQEYNAEYIPRI